MKILLVLAALFVGASAEARINTQDLSTAQVKALIQESGAIVLSTGEFTFDRFVANKSFCAYDKAVHAYVPTLDSDSAFVGYTCEAYSRGDVAGSDLVAQGYTCQDGAVQSWAEDKGNGRQVAVPYICKAGKWKRADGKVAKAPKKVVCKEGTYGFTNVDKGNGREVRVTTVCRGGKYVRLN